MRSSGKAKRINVKDAPDAPERRRRRRFRVHFRSFMAESLANQLAGVKLKPSRDKTKDFSDPKLAGLIEKAWNTSTCSSLGFLNASEISSYQRNAREANIEEWQIYLVEGTMKIFISPHIISFRNIRHGLFSSLFVRCRTFHSHLPTTLPVVARSTRVPRDL